MSCLPPYRLAALLLCIAVGAPHPFGHVCAVRCRKAFVTYLLTYLPHPSTALPPRREDSNPKAEIGLESLRSHCIPVASVDPTLLHELRNFAACIVLSKMRDHVEDLDIIAPMGNPPKPELLYNTKLSVQFARLPKGHTKQGLNEPVIQSCSKCSGYVPADGTPIGGRFQCPSCSVVFTRKNAYEVGSGRSSIGRNLQQLKIFDFCEEMETLVQGYEDRSGGQEHYTHVTLVIYHGKSFCASCALTSIGVNHGTKRCASWLGGHRDNGGSSNSQVERSMTRTLSVGATRILSMEMLSRNEDGMNWSSVPGTTVDFELKDGSEFVLDTGDEVEMERTGRGGMMVNGAWFHGMVTAVEDNGISCGFVARDVRTVRDVRLDTDVVILAGGSYVQTSKYDDMTNMWKTRGAPVYKAKTGALLGEAVKKWHVRSARATEKRTMSK